MKTTVNNKNISGSARCGAILLAAATLLAATSPAWADKGKAGDRDNDRGRGRDQDSPACAGKGYIGNAIGDYTLQVIDPPPDTTQIWWVFINERNMVVMQYFTEPVVGAAQGHTAILEDGVWKVIDLPGSFWCGASNPNASGRVGLVYVLSEDDNANGIWHNAIYHRGTYTPLPDYTPAAGTPAYQYGVQEINDRGIMTGVAFDPASDIDPDGTYHYHGLLFDASLSLFHVFDPPGSLSTFAFGLNNAGWMVGWYLKEDGKSYGFLSDRGQQIFDLNFPGADQTWPCSINNRGEIAGQYAEPDGLYKEFLLRQGKFAKFIMPDTQYNTIDWIVDNGQLSGNYLDLDGKPHGFIATPKHGRK